MSKHIHIHTAALLRPKVKAKDSKITSVREAVVLGKQYAEKKASLEELKADLKSVYGLQESSAEFRNAVNTFKNVKSGNYDHEAKDAGEITYFKGNKASYTGKKEELYGRTAYEIKLLEGPEKGKTKVTYREPGKIGPANLDSKDESVETKARHEGKLSETTEKQISYAGSPKRADMPSGVFLKSSNKTYPVKKKVNGEWKYDKGLLLAAARRARMEGDESLANKADAIREKMEKNED